MVAGSDCGDEGRTRLVLFEPHGGVVEGNWTCGYVNRPEAAGLVYAYRQADGDIELVFYRPDAIAFTVAARLRAGALVGELWRSPAARATFVAHRLP